MNTSSPKYLAASFALLLISGAAYAQSTEKPAFEGFSYEQKSPFNTNAAPTEQYREWTSSALQDGPAEVNLDCAPAEQTAQLTDSELFEMQLGLDRVLSNILKLTVDYDALLVRVDNLQAAFQQRNEVGVSEAGDDDDEQRRLLEAMDLQSKQLIEREQKIARLEERLVVAQGRFDSENLARLKSEKVIRNQEEQRKTMQLDLDRKDEQLIALKEQAEEDNQRIRQLQSELAKAKREQAAPAAEAVVTPKQMVEQSQPEPRPDSVPAPVLSGTPGISPAREWVLEGLRFERGSADIDPASIGQLKELLQLLREQSQLNVQINGYTDSVGSARSNLKLSQKRADSVADYLVRQGIDSSRLAALGYGERRPLADNETEEGRIRNRRVGVLLLQ